MNHFDLTDRVVVITGGTGLLGLSHARAIHGAGAIPVLLDIRPADASLSTRAGFDVICLTCDITDESDITAALASILDRFWSNRCTDQQRS